MKKLEELGISPAPWMVLTVNGSLHSVEASPCFIGDLMHIATVCNMRKARPSDARIIAAAPNLYVAGWKTEAVLTKLFTLDEFAALLKSGATDALIACRNELRAALAKAAGDGGEA